MQKAITGFLIFLPVLISKSVICIAFIIICDEIIYHFTVLFSSVFHMGASFLFNVVIISLIVLLPPLQHPIYIVND